MTQSDTGGNDDGIAQSLPNSRLNIVVTRGKGQDVFVKADGQVMLLDESEARDLAREITETLEGGSDE